MTLHMKSNAEEVNCAKSHFRVISEGLYSTDSVLLLYLSLLKMYHSAVVDLGSSMCK